LTENTKLLDCDTGRKLGCKSFCCRLLIRLDEDDRTEIDPETQRKKGYVGKKDDGTCLYQDEQTGLCLNWDNRPKVCREYDCNFDKLLQVVFKSSNQSISCWMKESVTVFIHEKDKIFVPYL